VGIRSPFAAFWACSASYFFSYERAEREPVYVHKSSLQLSSNEENIISRIHLWFPISQIKDLANLIEVQHSILFKTDQRARGYGEAVLEQLTNGALGEEIKGVVLKFMDGKSKDQITQHIRGLKSKHCPDVFQHERDFKEAQAKEEELKRAASQVPIVVQADNAGIPGAGAGKEAVFDYLNGFVGDKIVLAECGKEFCKSEAFRDEGRAAIARSAQWKMKLCDLSDEKIIDDLCKRIGVAVKNGCAPTA
jgi:hypothetical protein